MTLARCANIIANVLPWTAATVVMLWGCIWTPETAIITVSFMICLIVYAVLRVVREDLHPLPSLPSPPPIPLNPVVKHILNPEQQDVAFFMNAGRQYWVARYQRDGMTTEREIEFAEAARRSHVEKHCDTETCYFCLLRSQHVPYI